MKKIRLSILLAFLGFLITACSSSKINNNTSIEADKILEVNLKNVIISINENEDIENLDCQYDSEMYKVNTSTNKNITTVDISALNSDKEIQLHIPPNMYQEIRVKGNNSIITINKINSNYDILMNRGILKISLPDNYNKSFNLISVRAINQIELNKAIVSANIKNKMGYIQVPDDWEVYSDQKEYLHNAIDAVGKINIDNTMGDIDINKSDILDEDEESVSNNDSINKEEAGNETEIAENKININLKNCNANIKTSDTISDIKYDFTDSEVQVEREEKDNSTFIYIGKESENNDITSPKQSDILSSQKCDVTILIPNDIYNIVELEADNSGIAISDMTFGMNLILYGCALDLEVPLNYQEKISCKTDYSSCTIWFKENMKDFNLTVDSDMSVALPRKWPNSANGLKHYEYIGKEDTGSFNFNITNSSFAIRLY